MKCFPRGWGGGGISEVEGGISNGGKGFRQIHLFSYFPNEFKALNLNNERHT